MNRIEWIFKEFSDLNGQQVFDMLELRCEVFIVEQTCPYQDPDKKDLKSFHLLAYEDGKLCGCLRLVKPGVSYDEASIGRVCTKYTHRRTGLGKILMQKAMELSAGLGWNDLRISAQLYLEKFYSDFGFVSVSESYMEDDIPHIQMLCKK